MDASSSWAEQRIYNALAVAALEVAGSVMVVQGCLGSTHAEALHSVLQSENRVMAAL